MKGRIAASPKGKVRGVLGGSIWAKLSLVKRRIKDCRTGAFWGRE